MDRLAQLAEGIFPPSAEARIVAVLFGYMDESGTDGLHNATVISGIIGPVKEWSRLLREWDEQLAKDGIETFHCVECKGRNGEYRGWTRDQSEAHLAALAATVDGQGVAAINAGFNGNYPALITQLPPIFREQFPTAYSLCFQMFVARIRQAMRDHWQPQPVALIFARQEQFQGLALQQWNIARDNGLWPEICHVGYGDPAELHQLQVADMLAWETRRYMWDQTPAETLGDLPLLSRIVAKERDMGNTLYEIAMDEDAVRTMAAQMQADLG